MLIMICYPSEPHNLSLNQVPINTFGFFSNNKEGHGDKLNFYAVYALLRSVKIGAHLIGSSVDTTEIS